MRFLLRATLLLPLVVAACSSSGKEARMGAGTGTGTGTGNGNSTDPDAAAGTPPGLGLHPGVTSASMACSVANGAPTDPQVDLSCSVRAHGAAPPPTLRLALVWLQRPASIVIELGERSTSTPFDLSLAVPPDAAITPASGPGTLAVAIGRYTLYDDGNGNGALDLGTPATGLSPDRILAAARHLILYYPGTGFQIEETTPLPAPEDCSATACFLPTDHGSALMGPSTKIELVPIGPVTSRELACDPSYGDSPNESLANGPSGVPPKCSFTSAPPAGSGVVCSNEGLGDILVETSCPPVDACSKVRNCTWCVLARDTFRAHPQDSPCSVSPGPDGGE